MLLIILSPSVRPRAYGGDIGAPLYAEMSQLLGAALGQYEEGLRLFQEGRREEGLRLFDGARKKLRQVRLLFPAAETGGPNDAAALLELRIDQLTNPAAFNLTFRRRLAEAAAGIRKGSSRAFRELRNLAALNPRCPGIGALLEQAEAEVYSAEGELLQAEGTMSAASTPENRSRSDEISSAVRRLLQESSRWQYPRTSARFALEQLNYALLLDPDNKEALTLKDRLQIALGGPPAVILDSAAERDYQRAVRELHLGNPLIALAILEDLLRNPRYHPSARLEDLRRRIEPAL